MAFPCFFPVFVVWFLWVMTMTIHKSAEDYLEAMLMLKEERGYIGLDPAGMIVLLEPGMEIAERIYERHKLLTELLIRLGVSPETARDDACKIEHDLSVETFDAIRRHAKQYS